MRILVCGGRDFTDEKRVYDFLDKFHKEYYIDSIVEGDARGVDRIAGQWAKRNHVDLYPVAADWNKHGKRAGPLRNIRMLEEFKPDVVIAFPGGRGTDHMVRISKEAGVKVVRI